MLSNLFKVPKIVSYMGRFEAGGYQTPKTAIRTIKKKNKRLVQDDKTPLRVSKQMIFNKGKYNVPTELKTTT